jgi:amino acid transporter
VITLPEQLDIRGGESVSESINTHSDDEILARFGYGADLERILRRFTSFAIVFSFISISTGIFTAYGFVISGAGPRGIWSWPLVCVGQILVALVLAALAGRIPISGMSYQWMSRMTSPSLGWFLGWGFLGYGVIVGPAVNLVFVGILTQLTETSPSTNQVTLMVVGVTLVQASCIAVSTRITARVNNLAVWTEIISVAVFGVVLVVIGLVNAKHGGGTASLWSTAGISSHGYWYIFGPFFGTVVLGAFTFTGFDTAAALSDETQEPHRNVPLGIIRATVLSAIMGMLFLLGITLAVPGNFSAVANAASPVGFVAQDRLGTVIGDILIICVAVAVFANSLINMTVQNRLVWAISRDRRFPLSSIFYRLNLKTDTPLNAVVLITVAWCIVTAIFTKLSVLVAASAIVPVLLYLIITAAYAVRGRRFAVQPGGFSLGRFDRPVTIAALVWGIVLTVLLAGPAPNHKSAAIAGAIFASGLVWWVALRVFAPSRLSSRQDETASAALTSGAVEDVEGARGSGSSVS